MLPTSSTDIWRIEVEYLKDKGKKKKNGAPIDSFFVINTQTTFIETCLPTLSLGPLGNSCVVPYDHRGSSNTTLPPRTVVGVSWSPITHTSLLRMEQVAYYADLWASKLEASILGLIQTDLGDVVALLSTSIDSIAVKIKMCEHVQGATEEVKTLKVVVAEVRRDIN